MSNQTILKFLNGRPVTILVPGKENYGVRVYSTALADFLGENGVPVSVQSLTFLGCLKVMFRDRDMVFVTNLAFLAMGLIFRSRAIAVLHGFPNRSDYSAFRFFITKLISKIGSSFSGLVIANSGLTKEINEKFLNTKSDVVWNPYQSNKDDKELTLEDGESAEKPSLIFVGRILKAKGFDRLASHLKKNLPRYSQITIIGPDVDGLTKQLEGLKNVDILGSIPHEQVKLALSKHDIFVSLNFLEPYGLVYQEAEEMGCIVVCPVHCGYAERTISQDIIKVSSSATSDIQFAMAEARALAIRKKAV